MVSQQHVPEPTVSRCKAEMKRSDLPEVAGSALEAEAGRTNLPSHSHTPQTQPRLGRRHVHDDLSLITGRSIQIEWLSSATIAPYSVVIVEVWQKTSFVMLFLLAALSMIPDEMYDAAKVDGASSWQTFRYLTLPFLRTTIVAVTVVRLIDLLKMFDLPYVLTAGGPGVATEPISMHIMQVGFQFFRIGAGAAQSFLLFLGVGALALVLVRALRTHGAAR